MVADVDVDREPPADRGLLAANGTVGGLTFGPLGDSASPNYRNQSNHMAQ